MTHPIIKTDNYILITSDEEIKMDDYYLDDTNIVRVAITECESYWTHRKQYKKVIAHLPLNNSPILEGVTLLPSLTNEEDVDELAEQEYSEQTKSYEDDVPEPFYNYPEYLKVGFITGYNKAKEKYKFTEEDMVKAFEYGKTLKGYDWIGDLIESLSQPKLPVGFNCEMEYIDPLHLDKNGNYHSSVVSSISIAPYVVGRIKIINGVMQGEWIFE